jgi:4-hydroxybenzoate polyprenyltransferase
MSQPLRDAPAYRPGVELVPARAAGRRNRAAVRAALVALRPADWLKNLFVLAAVVFAGRLDDADAVLRSAATFVALCAMASAGYLLNDLVDRQADRQHSLKRSRPIAAGQIALRSAAALSALLAAGAIAVGAPLSWKVAVTVAGYGAISVTYSLLLKRIVIVDAIAIAGCFLLRVLAGGEAIGVRVSLWLVVCTVALSLSLAFTKRRQEAVSEPNAGVNGRAVLERYSVAFLDRAVALSAAAAAVAYLVYATQSPHVGDRMLITTPMALAGISRYLYLVYVRRDVRPTATLIVRDYAMLAAVLAWIAAVLAVLYL